MVFSGEVVKAAGFSRHQQEDTRMKKVFHLMVAVFAILCMGSAFADTGTAYGDTAHAVTLEPLAIGPDHDEHGNPVVPMPEIAGLVTGRTCCTKSVDPSVSAGPGDDNDDDAGGDAHDGMAGGPSFRDGAGHAYGRT
jgi:hypothetical protein